MAENGVIGREYEQRVIKSYMDSGKAELVAVDLLIDRADEVINICEIKYVADKYEITADYEERLRNRASLFRQVTKTKKALYHTFITTYGVAQNMHSGVVQSEVTANDLFEP